jgi:hypothetical protein
MAKRDKKPKSFSRREFLVDSGFLIGGTAISSVSFLLSCSTNEKIVTQTVTATIKEAPTTVTFQPTTTAGLTSMPATSSALISELSLAPVPSPSPTTIIQPPTSSLTTPTNTIIPPKTSSLTPKPTPEPSLTAIPSIPATSACAITSPPPSMAGINTHTELYGTGADPNIITLGPKVGGHPGWPIYEHHPGMTFEAYNRGSPVLAPLDMILVGFRDTSTSSQIVPGGTFVHTDDVKLFFESASPDWPGVYMSVYHLLTSPLLTGHTQSASNDLLAPPAQGFQLFWDGNFTLSTSGNASSYGALIGYKVKRGELIGFAGTVPLADGVGTHSFADFYFDVPDASINPNITKGDIHLHLVQPGSFFYWKSYSPDATFASGVLAYPFECDGYRLPVKQRDVNFKYPANKYGEA